MLTSFLEAPRPAKRLISVTYDCIAISLSLYLAWALRLGTWSIETRSVDWACLLIMLIVSVTTFVRLGLYRAILRYMAHQAAITVLIGTMVSSLTLAAASFYRTHQFHALCRSSTSLRRCSLSPFPEC